LETYGEVTAMLSLMTGVELDVGETTIARGKEDDSKECEVWGVEVMRWWGDEIEVKMRGIVSDSMGDECQ
jgi:hypothetical protein